MDAPSENEARRMVLERLEDIHRSVAIHGDVEELELWAGENHRPFAVVQSPAHRFVVEWKSSDAAASMVRGLEQLADYVATGDGELVPVLAVPYMGEAGRQRCQEAGVSWLDLSGNARITAPQLFIQVVGFPNKFKQRGRPANVFAPKSSRIVRWLLLHPDHAYTQHELQEATSVSKGLAHRVATRLEADGLVARDEEGKLSAPDPTLLVEAWRERYEFEQHNVIKGHIAARSGPELVQRIASSVPDVEWAATGLAAAWLYSRFASFRIATFYLRDAPTPALLERLSFRREDKGANTWLVVPNDEGVFVGQRRVDEIPCVHPLQVYLDLKGHPERAQEAAAELRKQLFTEDFDA